MNTLPWLRPRLFFYVCLATALVMLGQFCGSAFGASAQPSRRSTGTPVPTSQTPGDPYAAFVAEISRNVDTCKTHAEKLQTLLKQRAELVVGASGAAPQTGDAAGAVPKLNELDAAIAAAERALDECYSTAVPVPEPSTTPVATPTETADGKVIRPEKLKEPYEPPVPVPPTLTVPPAPPAEAGYVDFLAKLGDPDDTTASLLEDLRELFAMRRETAVRFLAADAQDRPSLGGAIYALSQRIFETARGIADPEYVTASGALATN